MFHNLRIGMKVEISCKNGNLYTGKVKWKGYVTGRTGEWIGIELDVPGKQQHSKLEMHSVAFLSIKIHWIK